jgi:hypothetical protein
MCEYLDPNEVWKPLTWLGLNDKASCEAYNKCSSGGICTRWNSGQPSVPAPAPISSQPLESNSPNVSAGGSGGSSVTPALCNPDELLVGVSVRSGQSIDGIASVYCNSTQNILAGAPPREIKTNWGGQGGSLSTFFCPTGAAIKSYKVGSGSWMDNISFQCQNVTTNAASDESKKFGGGDPRQYRACDDGQFLGGLSGNAGNSMDSIRGQCRDVSILQQAFRDPAVQLKCCSGEIIDPLQCANLFPSSSYCDTKTKPLTCSQRQYFFSPACKQILSRQNRQLTSQTDQDLAVSVCTQVKNDPNATQAEKDWCSCINAEIPPDIDPTMRGVFQCINSTCMTKGLLPFGLQCPTTYTICTNKDFQTALQSSEVGKFYIQNNCGSFNPPAPSPGPTPSPTPTPLPGPVNPNPSPTPSPVTPGKDQAGGAGDQTAGYNYKKIALYVLLGILLLGGVFAAGVLIMKRQQQKQQ